MKCTKCGKVIEENIKYVTINADKKYCIFVNGDVMYFETIEKLNDYMINKYTRK